MSNTNKKAKNMMYTQQLSHLKLNSVDEIYDKFEALNPKRLALIIHDKDIENGKPIPPHIHAMLSFKNARSLANVANSVKDQPQYIEQWTGNSNNGYAYLIHATDNARDKHRYKEDEVRANFDYPALIREIQEKVLKTTQANDVKLLLNAFKNRQISKQELEERLTGFEYGRLRNQIENINIMLLKEESEKWRVQAKAQGKTVKVIWIYGAAGTGKSSLAKEYAQSQEQSYYMSGSSRDLFQSYNGEHTIILDDIRAGNLSYIDFLRITDPYGIESGVYAPARYHDKPLACDLVIITAPMSPYQFYAHSVNSYERYFDGFDQMLRRIGLTIFMNMEYIYRAVFNDDIMFKYEFDESTKQHNKYSTASRTISTPSDEEIFKEMFG